MALSRSRHAGRSSYKASIYHHHRQHPIEVVVRMGWGTLSTPFPPSPSPPAPAPQPPQPSEGATIAQSKRGVKDHQRQQKIRQQLQEYEDHRPTKLQQMHHNYKANFKVCQAARARSTPGIPRGDAVRAYKQRSAVAEPVTNSHPLSIEPPPPHQFTYGLDPPPWRDLEHQIKGRYPPACGNDYAQMLAY